MLQHLSIQSFTIIDQLELEFKSGMTVLTGETGAGKSILIDALMLTLGGRADSNVIRVGTDRCTVTASFSIQKLPAARTWLEEHELASDDECLLRRTISNDGRSRAFINGQAVPVQQLKELSSLLISIHGQHEHQTLLKPDKQRSLLDGYGGNASLARRVSQLYNEWQAVQNEFAELQKQAEQRVARQELLTYQLQELEKINLQPGELTELDQEQRQLANAGHLINNCQTLLTHLAEGDECNVLSLLNNTLSQLIGLQNLDNRLANTTELLNNAEIQIQEAVNELRHYADHLDLNPERLHWVEERLSAIHELARKHRVSPNELIDLQQRLENELKQLTNCDIQLQTLQQKIFQLAQDYQTTATELSKSRQKAAKQLCPLVEKSIHELNMAGGRFTVQFTANLDAQPASYGLERVEFFVSTNPGQNLLPLAKVVSGGELSRISLAIHVLTAKNDTTPTLIFDEVDVGIGGGTAEIVGRLLRTLANSTQVLCVTHLPQVAAQGQNHFQIGKVTQKDTTHTQVRVLDQAEKIQEIARMLGGVKITQQTLAHAKEMLGVEE